MISNSIDSIKEQAPKVIEQGIEKMKEVAPKVKEGIQEGYEKVKEQIPKVKDSIEQGIDKVKEQTPPEVKEGISSGIQKIKDFGRSFLGFFKRLFNKEEEKKEIVNRRKRQFSVSYEPSHFNKNWNFDSHKFNYNKFSGKEK